MREHLQIRNPETASARTRARSCSLVVCTLLVQAMAACTSLNAANKKTPDASSLNAIDGVGGQASGGSGAGANASGAASGGDGAIGAANAGVGAALATAGASSAAGGTTPGIGASGTSAAASGGATSASGGATSATGGAPAATGGAPSGSGGAAACVPTQEVCDGKDNDCDTVIDNGVKNLCGGCTTLDHMPDSACTAGSGDCQGTGSYKCQGQDAVTCNAVAKQPTAESCDGKDNNCNGLVDEGVATTWYPDCDGDGYPAFAIGVAACSQPAAVAGCGWTSRVPTSTDTDCNDQLDVAHPGADYGLPIERTGQALPAMNDTAYDLNCDGKLDYESVFSTGKIVGGQLEMIPFCDTNTACVGNMPLCLTSWHFSGVPSCGVGYPTDTGCSGSVPVYVLCK